MIVLGIDTCMEACSAAVFDDQSGALAREHVPLERGHAEALMPMVERVMAAAEIPYDAIDRIAVTTGPGSFTGVRVGVAAARGLALATGASIVGIPSLEVIARQVRETLDDRGAILGIATDARRGQVYFASYDSEGAEICAPVAIAAEDAAQRLPETGMSLLAGSGAAMVAEAASERQIEVLSGIWLPDAGTLARMAVERAPSPVPVEPLYLRPPDAKPQADKMVARQ